MYAHVNTQYYNNILWKSKIMKKKDPNTRIIHVNGLFRTARRNNIDGWAFGPSRELNFAWVLQVGPGDYISGILWSYSIPGIYIYIYCTHRRKGLRRPRWRLHVCTSHTMRYLYHRVGVIILCCIKYLSKGFFHIIGIGKPFLLY